MVRDDDISRVKPVHLVSQHEGAFGVSVVGHNIALGLLAVWQALIKHLVSLDELKELCGL